MSDEWWEPGVNESRILFLYRRYDAICHLIASIAGQAGMAEGLRAERHLIMAGLVAEFPRSALDFAAQTVVLAQLGQIEVTAQEVQACIALLNRHIEALDTRQPNPAARQAASSVEAWRGFQAFLPAASRMAAARPGVA